MGESNKVFLAVDLGASGGRVVAGLLQHNRLQLEEVHRFENGGVLLNERLYWDLPRLWSHVVDGLRLAAHRYGERIASVGVDTWGVDFGLLDRNDELLGNPYCYRDLRTAGILPQAFEVVGREQIFAETGLQFMEFNTLFQLHALRRQKAPVLEVAEHLLMIPDIFHWLLSGEKTNEYSNATTTQIYNPLARSWSQFLIEKFAFNRSWFGSLVEPGTRIGTLRKSVREQTGMNSVQIIVPGTHDTASAVMAVPTSWKVQTQPTWCYISSGTWSLMGVEVPGPVINDTCRSLNFTNEGGVGGTTRLLKNIAGLWLIQECRRIWRTTGHDRDWQQLLDLARQSPPLRSLLDPDHSTLVAPTNMPAAIQQRCRDLGEPVPETEGALVRCILESLAMRYRMVLGWLEQLTGGSLATVHIVGGGSQNALLNQWTADACQRRVVAGPTEATAIGNLLSQIVATGDAGSISEAREIVQRSFEVAEYEPRDTGPWDDAFVRFRRFVS